MALLKVSYFIDKFYHSTFARNVAMVAGGTAASQAITLAFAPILTRLYGPEAFGVLGTFMAIATVFTPIAALTYPIAIILPKRDSDALGLVRLSLLIASGFTLLTALFLLLFKVQIIEGLNLQTITPYILLIPVIMLLSACLQVAQQWLIRKKEFGITARVSVATTFLVNSTKTVFGLINPVAAVLVVVATLGSALNTILLVIGARKTSPINAKPNPSASTPFRELAKRHLDFPFFRAPQVFISQISLSLPILLLASFFGPAAAGFYSVCRRVLTLPSSLIAGSVGTVFYPRITEAAHQGENLTRLITKATLALGAVGVFPFGMVILFGPWLFSLVFGLEWVRAGEYGRWLALWMFFVFLNNPSVRTLPVLSAQFFFLIYTVFNLVIRTGVLLVGFYVYKSDLVALALFGISGAILNIALILIIIYKSYRYDQKTILHGGLA